MRTTPSGANSGTPRGLDPATIQKAAAGLSSSVFNNLSAAAAAAGHTTPGVAGYRQVMAQHPVSLDIVKDWWYLFIMIFKVESMLLFSVFFILITWFEIEH